jgi:Tol biopolymer transport system component
MSRTRPSRPRSLLGRVALTLVAAAGTIGAVRWATTDAARRVVSVTLTEGTNMAASASPDGRSLVLAIQGILWSIPSTGGEARRLTGAGFEATWPAWSPDGSRVAFQNYSADGFYHIWTIAADGSDARQVTTGPFDHREPAWSPDGARIAFTSDRARSGSYDIWTLDFRTGSYAQRTNETANEVAPAWSPDGSTIA